MEGALALAVLLVVLELAFEDVAARVGVRARAVHLARPVLALVRVALGGRERALPVGLVVPPLPAVLVAAAVLVDPHAVHVVLFVLALVLVAARERELPPAVPLPGLEVADVPAARVEKKRIDREERIESQTTED